MLSFLRLLPFAKSKNLCTGSISHLSELSSKHNILGFFCQSSPCANSSNILIVLQTPEYFLWWMVNIKRTSLGYRKYVSENATATASSLRSAVAERYVSCFNNVCELAVYSVIFSLGTSLLANGYLLSALIPGHLVTMIIEPRLCIALFRFVLPCLNDYLVMSHCKKSRAEGLQCCCYTETMFTHTFAMLL